MNGNPKKLLSFDKYFLQFEMIKHHRKIISLSMLRLKVNVKLKDKEQKKTKKKIKNPYERSKAI